MHSLMRESGADSEVPDRLLVERMEETYEAACGVQMGVYANYTRGDI